MTKKGGGHVAAVCIGDARSCGKSEVPRACLRKGFGLVGDAHAGPGDRQVSLVDVAEIEKVNRANGFHAGPGDFAANVGVAGLDLMGVPIGGRLRAGRALLEVTHVGKNPSIAHSFSFRGVSLLVEKGLFCRVLSGGWVQAGDPVRVVQRDSAVHHRTGATASTGR